MLHPETIKPDTFSLLKRLMQIPELKDFSLVGGTALTLLYGHRISVDLDLFSNKEFRNDEIIKVLTKTFGNKFIMEEKPPKFGIFCYINNDKVDIIRHPHPLIRKEPVIDGIRMFSTEDIIAIAKPADNRSPGAHLFCRRRRK